MEHEKKPNVAGQLRDLKYSSQQIFPARAAQAYMRNEVPVLSPDPLKADVLSVKEAQQILDDELKEDRFGVLRIILDWMADGASEKREQRPPFGLIYPRNGKFTDFSEDNALVLKDKYLLLDPFSTFSYTMRYTLGEALSSKFKHINSLPVEQQDPAYKRSMKYGQFSNTDPVVRVVNNLNGLEIMGDILKHTPDIVSASLGKTVSVDEQAQIALNTLPLILNLASHEGTAFNIIHNLLRDPASGSIHNALHVVGNNDFRYFQIKHSKIDEIKDALVKLEGGKRGGCPALSGAIETLWKWYIDYAADTWSA